MTYPNDPNFRREMQVETDREGVATATWASIAFVLLLFGGVAVWAFYGDNATNTASVNRPGVEQSLPPATTGQGGASSRMPAAKDKDM